MPTPTLIATVGAIDANSFGTRAEADAYHDSVLHADEPWPANVQATAQIGSGENGVVTITVEEAGTEGNDYSVVAVLGSGNNIPLSAALVGNVLTVTLGTDSSGVADSTKNKAILVAGAIDDLAEFSATHSGGGGTAVPVTASTEFSGGSYVEETKIPALIMAQQQMTALIEWTGFATTLTQKLPWPRTGMWARNEMSYISESVIPDEVKWAQFELARLLINEDRTVDSEISVNGLTHLRAGPVTMKFREFNNYGPAIIPSAIVNLLVPSWYTRVIGERNTNIDLVRV